MLQNDWYCISLLQVVVRELLDGIKFLDVLYLVYALFSESMVIAAILHWPFDLNGSTHSRSKMNIAMVVHVVG